MLCCNHRRGNECPSENNAGMQQSQQLTMNPSFILHNTPASITFWGICIWWYPPVCLTVSCGTGSCLPTVLSSVLCLIYCNPVLTDMFCSNTRQPLHNNKPSYFLCVQVWGWREKSYWLGNNGALLWSETVDWRAVKYRLISFVAIISFSFLKDQSSPWLFPL